MNIYSNNGLNIESDFEIRHLMQIDNDIDVLIPIELRVLNLHIEDMPDFLSNRLQFTEVKNILIRHTMDKDNTSCTIHFLRSIDIASALVNFTLDYKGYGLRIVKQDYSVDMFIEKYRK